MSADWTPAIITMACVVGPTLIGLFFLWRAVAWANRPLDDERTYCDMILFRKRVPARRSTRK